MTTRGRSEVAKMSDCSKVRGTELLAVTGRGEVSVVTITGGSVNLPHV